jgi:hypothetical protein
LKALAITFLALLGLPILGLAGCAKQRPCEVYLTLAQQQNTKTRDVRFDDLGVCADDLRIVGIPSGEITYSHWDYSLNCDIVESVVIHDDGNQHYFIFKGLTTIVITKDEITTEFYQEFGR